MLTELFQHYLVIVGYSEAPFSSEPSSRVRDFIALERETLHLSTASEFWKQYLENCIFNRIHPWYSQIEDRVHNHKIIDVPISKDISDALLQLAKTLSVPVKSIVLAAHSRVIGILSWRK